MTLRTTYPKQLIINQTPMIRGRNPERKTKHGLVGKDIIRRRGSVPAHDKFVRNINQTERTCDDHRCVDGARDARGFDSWMHGFSPVFLVLLVGWEQPELLHH